MAALVGELDTRLAAQITSKADEMRSLVESRDDDWDSRIGQLGAAINEKADVVGAAAPCNHLALPCPPPPIPAGAACLPVCLSASARAAVPASTLQLGPVHAASRVDVIDTMHHGRPGWTSWKRRSVPSLPRLQRPGRMAAEGFRRRR